ncbi:deaminase [bacterium]|jgi:dCMP deaminase|nr:deaminase [bacterium]
MPNIKELDIVYMNIAGEVSQLSKCSRKKVGAIIVKDNNILSFGYNGTPSGFCNTCEEDNKTKWSVLHAESNAIVKVAKSTNSSSGSTLYCTLSPCKDCSKLIIQAGIIKVVYKEVYEGSTEGLDLMKESGIKIIKI